MNGYRETSRRPRRAFFAFGRAHRTLVVIAALMVAFGAVFATRARVTFSCRREEIRAASGGVLARSVTRCHVVHGGSFSRVERDVLVHEGERVSVQRYASRVRVVVSTEAGELLLVEEDAATLPPNVFERQAEDINTLVKGDSYATSSLDHVGGWVLDGGLVLWSFGSALLLILFALRAHRVVVDHDAEEMRATTFFGILHWPSRRARLGRGDRVLARRGELVLVSDGPDRETAVVILEERGAALARLAARIDQSLR